MRTASRGSNRRLRDRKWTVCRVFWRLAGFELLFVSEVSQELTCSLAKKAVEITSLCFTLYIHRYTNIQNQVYGDIYIYIYLFIYLFFIKKLKKLLLRIESLQNYLVSQIFILFFDFWLNLAKGKKSSFRTIGQGIWNQKRLLGTT
jgi:glycosyltransferase involved in cell wall biosynthesis